MASGCLAPSVDRDTPRRSGERKKGTKIVSDAAAGRQRPVPRVLVAAALLLCAAIAQSADEVSVTTAREGDAVRVQAQAIVHAPREVIWQTLTDYENLPRFVPGMEKSRVLRREGNAVVVEQVGRTSFLFFSFPLHLIVRAEEAEPRRLHIRLVSGNLRQLDSVYRIESIEGRDQHFLLRWTAVMEADLPVPLFVAVRLVRMDAQEQFAGIVAEIERREQARGRSG